MANSSTRTGGMSQVLRFLLEERGETATKVSHATGVPRSTISSWIAGRRVRDLEQVRKVARYLGTSFEFLVFGEVEEGGIHITLLDRVFEGPVRLRVERLVDGTHSCHSYQAQIKPPTP